MNGIESILAGLQSDRAIQREQTIKTLPSGALDDPHVIERLQDIVSSDPVEYVRVQARQRLLAAGQTPREGITPVKLKNGISGPCLFVLAIPVIAIAFILCVLFIYILCAPVGSPYLRCF